MEIPNLLLLFHVIGLFTLVGGVTEFKPEECGSSYCGGLSRLAVDEDSGYVFVGARSHLYQLRLDLEMINVVETKQLTCTNPENCKYNGNKVLLVDKKHNRLLACRNIGSFECSLYDIDDIKKVLHSSTDVDTCLISKNNYDSGEVAFITTENDGFYDAGAVYVASSKSRADCKVKRSNSFLVPFYKFKLSRTNNGMDMFKPITAFFKGTFGVETECTYFRQNFVGAYLIEEPKYPFMYFVKSYSNKTLGPGDKSYISRFCHGQYHDAAQLELPISCRHNNGQRYNKVIASHMMDMGDDKYLIAAFAPSLSDSGGSVVCKYNIDDLERTFAAISTNCTQLTPQYLWPIRVPWATGTSTECKLRNKQPEKPNLCKDEDPLRNLQASLNYTVDSFYQNDEVRISSIESVAKNSMWFTIFLGTEDGKVVKVKLNSSSNKGEKFEELQIDTPTKLSRDSYRSESAITSLKIRFDSSRPENSDVYALSTRLIAKIPVQNCSQYMTCQACSGSNDPFCGWCTLENKCSVSRECSKKSENYLYIEVGKTCPELKSSQLAIAFEDLPKQLNLQAFSIPYWSDMKGTYYCRFDSDGELVEIASLRKRRPQGFSIKCSTPDGNQLPEFPDNESKVLKLELIYALDGGGGSSSIGDGKPPSSVAVASVDLDVYKCSKYTSCFSCLMNDYKCQWNNAVYSCYSRSVYITAESLINDREDCPTITGLLNLENTADQNSTSGTAYISNRKLANVVLTTKNMGNIFKAHTDKRLSITCNIEGFGVDGIQEVNAVVTQMDRIKCQSIRGQVSQGYMSQRGKLTVSMTRRSQPNRNVQIDSTRMIAVESYRCELGAENSCGNCLTSNKYWKCGWCSPSQICTEKNSCTPLADWLPANNANQVCANPTINSFSPLKASVGTATNVTLNGKNFDQQLKMKILVAQANCEPLEIVGCCKLICRIDRDEARTVKEGNVTLCITEDVGGADCRPESQYKTFTDDVFNFVQPTIDEVKPDKVLDGWGSKLTLTGQHLDAGNKLRIKVGSQTCVVDESTRTSEKVECSLSCKNTPKRSRRKRSVRRHRRNRRHATRHSRSRRSSSVLTMSFDGGDVLPIGFEIVRDVTIDSVVPSTSIRSGGIPVVVRGTYLSKIEQPIMKITIMGRVYKESCQITGDVDELSCLTPDISGATSSSPDVDFEISSENGCSSIVSTFPLMYDSDPDLTEFKEVKTYTPGHILYIEGTNICPHERSCDNQYVTVLVDGEPCKEQRCNVVRVEPNRIQCALSGLVDGEHKIEVRIGGYHAQVGKIEYIANKTAELSTTIIVVIVVVVVIFLIVVMLASYKCYKKMESSTREVKEIQFKMNKLESEVAKACKEAFAELQTDSEDARALLGKHSSGTPYHDYRIYLIRVLFPDPSDSDKLLDLLLTNGGGSMSNQKRIAMTRFLTLMRNEGFLILFIHTLEAQRSFSMKDKAYVAGLVLIVLQDRLSYATHILEKLLAELITKGVSKESHPKLLFRRTESVAEKMLTHWFSMMLYGFLVAGAGESLYMLYRRLCQLIDKGPVDAMTNDARYSLSEDKLLRQSLEANRVVLKVKNYFEPNDLTTMHSIKVLSCDSISQVKRKVLDYLYGHIAYSQRVHPHKVDLEWKKKADQSGIILRDEDSSTRSEGEWKHINTLEHYKVTDGAHISVIPKKVNTLPHNYASSSMRSYAGFTKQDSTTRLLPSGDGSLPRKSNHKQTAASRPETPSTQPENIRYYHLTKPNDQEVRLGNNNNNGNKMVAEVYLTRLLTAKVALQKHVDDLFETIFSVEQRDQTLPIAVRHMFGFLDDQARRHNIQDQEIVHTWKTNCLPLRFWVNLIKNPEFVYDIYKSSIVDCCLSVIGQTFMDSCALGRQPLTKDSPTNKLLYAKEIPKYKTWVSKYYSDISRQPRLDRRHIDAYFGEESRRHENDFNTEAALGQLFEYVLKHSTALHKALNECNEGIRLQLSNQLAQIEDTYRSPTPAHMHNQYGSNGTLSGRRPYS